MPSTGLDRGQLHELFHALVVCRAAEERLELFLEQGHLKRRSDPAPGREAGAVGSTYALRRRTDGTGDVVTQTIRTGGAVFLLGGTPLEYFRQHLARATSPTGGRDAKVHWTDLDRGLLGPVAPSGTMLEVMAGITLSFRLKGEDRVGLVYAGDDATSTGAWHEGLNFAAVQRCPMVLVLEVNDRPASASIRTHTRVKSFVEKASGYGIAAESIDGSDVLAVFEAAERAVARARAGEGVTMVELEGSADRDPVDAFRTRLLEEGSATRDELDAIAARAEAEIAQAAEQAANEPLQEGPGALHDVYTDLRIRPPWSRLSEPHPHEA